MQLSSSFTSFIPPQHFQSFSIIKPLSSDAQINIQLPYEVRIVILLHGETEVKYRNNDRSRLKIQDVQLQLLSQLLHALLLPTRIRSFAIVFLCLNALPPAYLLHNFFLFLRIRDLYSEIFPRENFPELPKSPFFPNHSPLFFSKFFSP